MDYLYPSLKTIGQKVMSLLENGQTQPGETTVVSRAEPSQRHIAFPKEDVVGSTGAREYIARMPGLFTRFIYRRNALVLKIILMSLVFISGIYTKVYTGEHQVVINNHVGGVFYVVFGSLAFSVLFPKMKLVMPVILATGATCALEFVQWFRFPFMVELTQHKVFAYLFGNSFNPRDFIYYGIGAVAAVLVLWFVKES